MPLPNVPVPPRVTRRAFGSQVAGSGVSTIAAATGLFPGQAPGFFRRDDSRPTLPDGVASGDVGEGTAVVWSRTDRPARMVVEWATTDSFRDARRVVGPAALPESDFTAKTVLHDLPPAQVIVYRVTFQDLLSPKTWSEPTVGRFRTPPSARFLDVRFAWGGDVAGQGFGIDVSRGGMKMFETIRNWRPQFFLHSGDAIYADNPIPPEITLDDGTVWKNLVTSEKSRVAETQRDFRGNYRYNLRDEHYRRFLAEVPLLAQWDDHETTNNWYPGEILDDRRYRYRSVDLLAARGRRAFLEYMPIRLPRDDRERIDRTIRYGPHLEVFLLDGRSYRGPNTATLQTTAGPETAFLGEAQVRRLRKAFLQSDATWKVIASDMPIGLVVGDGPNQYEAIANVNGPPIGRELEIAELLRFLKVAEIHNVVWLTGDVHYAAAHYYDPARARFSDFLPFWEFVAGPLHAGTFGPNQLDDTFGPQVVYKSVPDGMKQNRPPSDGLQFFGGVRIAARTGVMTVSLHDLRGRVLYSVDLVPRV